MRDEGEPSIPNVVILLYDGETQVAETKSDENGEYVFIDLPGGTYHIVVINDPAYVFSPVVDGGNQVNENGSTTPVDLGLGETIDDWSVGMYEPVVIGNKVFDDLNGNGFQDEGEAGMTGITTILLDGEGSEVARQDTDANGYYRFEGLPPGTYSVQFEIPEGYNFSPKDAINMDMIQNSGSLVEMDFTSDINSETGVTQTAVLMSGDVDLTFDAGIFIPITISGMAWHDFNADGVRDEGEPGLEGSAVTLMNGDGEPVTVAITSADGTYSFTDLLPNTYYSIVMPPSPEYKLSPMVGDSDFDPNSFMNSPVNLASGGSDTFNAGFYKTASLVSWVWKDENPNGIQDADEGAFDETVTINLIDSTGAIVQTTQTAADGSYQFDDIVPGNYDVEFLIGEGNRFTLQNVGSDDSKDSDVDPDSGKAQVSIASGDVISNIAAGVTILASVGPNRVFEDNNGNGIQDEGEVGIPDLIVDLYDVYGEQVATTTTDENGTYEFTGLSSGNYYIQIEPEGTITFSPVVDGGNQVSLVEDQPYGTSPVVELTLGATEETWDVGMYTPVSIGNKVWNDLNGNGIQDVDEPGMPDVTAILVNGSGQQLATTTTDENGQYLCKS
jgi:hypothetical protein